MPLTSKGREILAGMEKTYGPEKAKQVLYASKNKGTITGIDSADWMDAFSDEDILETCAALERGDALTKPASELRQSIKELERQHREAEGAAKERIKSDLDYAKRELARAERNDANAAKLDALCDAAQNLENRVDMRLDDHRVLGGVGFTPPSGGVRGDAVKRLERFSLSDLQKGLSDLENELSDAITAGHNYRAGNLRRDIDDLKIEIASRK